MPTDKFELSDPSQLTSLDPRTGRITVKLADKRQMEKEAHTYYYPPGI